MRVLVRVTVAARLAVERQEHQAPRIEAGEHRRDDEEPERDPVARIGDLDDRVLGHEAREADRETDVEDRDAHAGDRERADHHRPERIGDLVAQPAVVPHVLLVVHRMDHGAGAEEQHRLEEGVGQQVEHRDRIGAEPRRDEHVAELRHGRIGDHALDVGLRQPDRRGEEGGGRPDDDDEVGRRGRVFHQRRHAADEEHARRHHGGGMDQRGDGGGPLHRVGQPGMQAELRRLAHGADEEEESQQVGRVPVGPQEPDGRLRDLRRGGEDGRQVDAVGQVEQPEDAEQEAEVADPVDDERLHRGRARRRLAPVEPDQQVGGDPDPFPAEEHLQQVVRRHQRQHREGEERQVGEEARLVRLAVAPLRVVVHVAEGIEVHERGHRRDHDQHDRRQPVQPDRPFGEERAGLDPAEQRDDLGPAAMREEQDP